MRSYLRDGTLTGPKVAGGQLSRQLHALAVALYRAKLAKILITVYIEAQGGQVDRGGVESSVLRRLAVSLGAFGTKGRFDCPWGATH